LKSLKVIAIIPVVNKSEFFKKSWYFLWLYHHIAFE